MKREIEGRIIIGFRRGLIRAVVILILAIGILLEISLPALAETTLTSTGVSTRILHQGAALAAGFSHTCAVLADHQVQCWGVNSYGQLGNGTITKSLVPVTVGKLTKAVAVGSGPYHTCVVLTDGKVQCWGSNAGGQLGNGVTINSSIPVTVEGLTNAIAVAGGYRHSCALLADRRVQCWGYNADGQLGDGTNINSSVPVFVTRLTNAIAVSSGFDHSCAVLADGRVQCWGHGSSVPLPLDGTTSHSSVPVTISGLNNVVGVTSGICDGYSCAVLSDGRVQCWGHNHFGALNRGFYRIPVTVTGLTDVLALAAGDIHNCALLADGQVQCWGDNGSLLGNGTRPRSSVPVIVRLANAVLVGGRVASHGK